MVKKKILLVDDDIKCLSIGKNILSDTYEVYTVLSGEDALFLLKNTTPDLLVLDVEMPYMDGYELAVKIREIPRFRKTPIVFLTSNATREHVIKAVKCGGNDYVLKPADKDIFLGKLGWQLLLREIEGSGYGYLFRT